MPALLFGIGAALGLGVWRQLPPLTQQTRLGLFATVVLGMVLAYMLGAYGRRGGGAHASATSAASADASSSARVQVNLYGSLDRLAHAEWRTDNDQHHRDVRAVRASYAELENAEDLDPVEARERHDAGLIEN